MFIGVDGSSDTFGAQPEADYEREYRNSFVRELYITSRHLHKRYFHGPDLFSIGREVVRVSAEVVNFIQHIAETTDDRTIVMAGHSRGGAVCIHAARRMRRMTWSAGMTIKCLALFDAVDWDIATETDVIPTNVEFAYHAMRHPDSGSRPTFGNAGVEAEVLVDFHPRRFLTTHSGVGGIPLNRLADLIDIRSDQPSITVEQEIRGIQKVKRWMWPLITNHMRLYEPVAAEEVRRTDTRPSPRWRRISQEVQEPSELDRVQDIFDELAVYRSQLSLEQQRPERGIPTLARLDLPNVDPIYGASRSFNSPSGISREEVQRVQELLREVYGVSAHRAVIEHAEADAIITAWNGNKVSDTGILYSDRPLCGYCATSLRRLLPLLRMRQLTIYQLEPETRRVYRAIITAVVEEPATVAE